MGNLGFWNVAEREPDRVAVIDAAHVSYGYGELAARAHQVVHGFRSLGLATGDVVAMLLPNEVDTVVLTLATSEAGLYLAPINYHLVGEEVAYIVADSGARVFVAHERFAAAAEAVPAAAGLARLCVGRIDGFSPLAEMVRAQPTTPPEGRTAGALMNYTSGTTGRPKGVKRPLSDVDPDTAAEMGSFLLMLFGIEPLGPGRHLVTAPLYHTAVAQYMTASLHGGHAAVLMDQWTPEGTLDRIARHRVTTTHMVPTMFHRLLKLPAEVKAAADLSSLTHVIHSAAPCPVPTKRAMLDWWGPVIYEYYAATEGGGTLATPEDWEKKPG
ncbi:MAG: AMP-binding protein, partial [Mycobacteriales bacterium]